MKLKSCLVALLIVGSITGCGNASSDMGHELMVASKNAVAREKFDSRAQHIMSSNTYDMLLSELEFMRGYDNISVDTAYSEGTYNSLNKAFYDISVTGSSNGDVAKAELFAFVDDNGKIESIKPWWKTID